MPEQPVEQESATLLYITDTCPLCGRSPLPAALSGKPYVTCPSWDGGCGARIGRYHQGPETPVLDDPWKETP